MRRDRRAGLSPLDLFAPHVLNCAAEVSHSMSASLKPARRALLLLGAGLALASLTGCVATSDFMYPAKSPEIAKRPDAATVIFVRPSAFAAAIKTTIFDGHGRFLGESLPSSYFAVNVPPGDHVFVAWAENTAALRATLAPGRKYYIEVATKLGALSARCHLLALTPRSESWAKVPLWLAESAQLVPDEIAGQSYLRSRPDELEERLRRAQEALTRYSAAELEARTLRPQDGQ